MPREWQQVTPEQHEQLRTSPSLRVVPQNTDNEKYRRHHLSSHWQYAVDFKLAVQKLSANITYNKSDDATLTLANSYLDTSKSPHLRAMPGLESLSKTKFPYSAILPQL